jgi:hypothetical protein
VLRSPFDDRAAADTRVVDMVVGAAFGGNNSVATTR